MELETYNLKFEYIQGVKNTLTDTLSRLLEIDPDVALPNEPPGTEFGYNFFEELPPVEVGEGVEIKPDPDTFFKDIDLHITPEVKIYKVSTSQRCKDKQYLAEATGR